MTIHDQPKIATSLVADPDWWRGAVIYQIYPRSFQDSNGDGIGDLAGIVERLPHVAALGVDAIWISPFFRSPMLDFGYDVSDYRDVDPMFGTLADFEKLVERAHELGLRVLIDLVLSHTSSQHPWFVESRASRENARADWYVWADPKPDGTAPNNWLSIFGGSAWEWDGERMQYYLHNFLVEQPDLNFHNPDVQDALLDVARFWLERGVDGFRLDTVNFYVHDKALRDNPALPPEARNADTAPEVNPYNFQNHLYDKNQPENIAFLKRLRALCDGYGHPMMVGEVGEAQRGTEIQAEYTGGGDKLHMCYSFDLLSNTAPSGDHFAEVLERTNRIVSDGWACWAFSNHDVVRHATRWSLNDAALRGVAALLLALRGTICLYQGEELGLTEVEVGFDDIQDPYGKRFWPKFKGRDGCRTPMPWEQDAAQGGFSEGTPWLPVAAEHLSRAVALQDSDQTSMLAFYRQMIRFRKAHPVFAKGSLEVLENSEDRIVVLREGDGMRMICAFNLGSAPTEFSLPEGSWAPAGGAPFEYEIKADGRVAVAAHEAVFATDMTSA